MIVTNKWYFEQVFSLFGGLDLLPRNLPPFHPHSLSPISLQPCRCFSVIAAGDWPKRSIGATKTTTETTETKESQKKNIVVREDGKLNTTEEQEVEQSSRTRLVGHQRKIKKQKSEQGQQQVGEEKFTTYRSHKGVHQ